METRWKRGDLDPTKKYIKVWRVKDTELREEVGQFVRSYRMGSGDGMTIHWEFIKDGNTIRVDDEMWGTVGGSELVRFIDVTES